MPLVEGVFLSANRSYGINFSYEFRRFSRYVHHLAVAGVRRHYVVVQELSRYGGKDSGLPTRVVSLGYVAEKIQDLEIGE